MGALFIFFLCFWPAERLFAQENLNGKIDSDYFELNLQSNPIQEESLLKSELSVNSKSLLAENTTFDPFIDYGEFQDDVTEEESINFFHHGRSISIALAGGYEAVTFNIRQIYGDNAFIGVNASFFLDLRFAIQLSGVFPTGHYNSLFNTSFPFAHYGLDLKYYWNRQFLNKDKDFFSPYIVFGPFHLNTRSPLPPEPPRIIPPQTSQTPQDPQTPQGPQTPQTPQGPQTPQRNLSRLERNTVASYNAAGVKIGFGFELALIQQSFIGFEFSYLYTVLLHENEDLTPLQLPPLPETSNHQNVLQRLQFPNRPDVRGYRFYGDLINIGLVFGINF